jgi:hypothetical protein
MKTKILLFTTTLLLSGLAWGQIIHVPGDQPTIQAGINAATDGDTILVAENTYYENIRFMGKAITVTSEHILDGDSSHIVNTIIDGSQAADLDSASTVMFVNGEDTTSIINGFTITGGSGVMFMTYVVRAGGGIFSYNAGCKITNNIITENHVEDVDKAGAAGIGCVQDQGDHWISIRDNYVGYNTALASGFTAFGGGMAIMPSCYIENNLIEHNTCTNTNGATDGGGIELEAFSGTNPIAHVNNNIIRYNELNATTSSIGAGIICYQVTPEIKDNVISNNFISAQTLAVGGGVFVNNSPGPVEITNNIIENNHMEAVEGAYGGGIRMVNISEVVNISDNIISGNTIDGGINAWGGGIGVYNLDNISITNNTIEHNSGNSTSQQAGGAGINLLMCGKSYITNNEINENTLTAGSNAWGGGILLDKAKTIVYINNNTISNNTSEGIGMGGGIGIYNDNDTASYFINSNMIMNNYSDSRGGGLFARNTYNMYMVNNLFKRNECDYSGGAVMFYMSAKESWRDDNYPVIANNTFINNTSANGGAIYNGYYDKVAIIFNSIFCDNSANLGRDLYNASTLDMLVYNNVIDTSMIYSPWHGANNIFCDPELQIDSLHLDLSSSCVNAGVESIEFNGDWYYSPETDIDGDERPFDWTLPDIGADEAQWYYVSKFENAMSNNMVLSVYPNPFSEATTIKFELMNGGNVKLEVYNSTGEQVETIASESMLKGLHQFEWDVSQLPAGIYFVKLNNGMQTVTKKLIKMK